MKKKRLTRNGTFHILSLVLLFLFSPVMTASCQTKKAEAPAWNGKPGEFKAAVLGTLRPGEPFVVAVSGAVNGAATGSAKMQAVLLREEKQLNKAVFFNMGEVSSRGPVYTAIMAVPSTSGFGKAVLRIEAQGRLIKTMELTIEERHFATESFTITPAMTDILTQPDPEKTRQAEQMWAIWIKTGEDIYTTGNFIMPVKSTVQTSIFGTRRVYKYPNGTSSSSIHSGVDWRAPKGTPISAPAPGKVALAMNRITTGNTVVIEHMPGVYSLYFHMDKLAVNAGDMVQTGMKLGEAGATGFATAAHLHWEIRVAAENTDPACFLGRAILDKKAILTILNE